MNENKENDNFPPTSDKVLNKEAEDLEDGEIESDDDDLIITSVQLPVNIPESSKSNKASNKQTNREPSSKHSNSSDVTAVDTLEKISPKTTHSSGAGGGGAGSKSSKKYRSGDEDDFAKNVENAIAAALKKDGIEPIRPEFKRREEIKEESPKSKSRKRKKRDPGKEKNKKKKHNHEEQIIESDIDENEMLCIRGASPPPLITNARLGLMPDEHPQPISYYDSDGSYSSYESDDSVEYRKPYEDKRQNRRHKDRRQKKGGRGGGEKRRNREDSDGDECSRNHDGRAQRKLELCKFYLMECCAKKEKCLYMHGDFPCKYYYLGMECVYKGNCKFSHGKPLTDQLRNILLKHIETAPKEILGNFRRISRENALSLLNATHVKLCEEKGVENTLATTSTTTTVTTTAASSSTQFNNPMNNNTSDQLPIIPSLLDMVIKPPPASMMKKDEKDEKEKLNKSEKPRKSRWCDNQTLPSMPNMSIPPPNITQPTQHQMSSSTNSPSSVLSLRNLTGVITHEQIEKLESMGIENLEQVSQLTVAQLNSIGLTISQINEIQLNALNIQKLGLSMGKSMTASSMGTNSSYPSISTVPATPIFSTSVDSNDSNLKSSNQDIDMRFITTPPKIASLPFAVADDNVSDSTSMITNDIAVEKMSTSAANVLTHTEIASPEPVLSSGKNASLQQQCKGSDVDAGLSNSNSVVDYSQYLKDAHIDAEKDDLNNISLDKDEEAMIEDEPELLIDESWCPSEDEHIKTNNGNNQGVWKDDSKKPLLSESVPEQSWDISSEQFSNNRDATADEEEDWSVCTPVNTQKNINIGDNDEENWDDDIDRPQNESSWCSDRENSNKKSEVDENSSSDRDRFSQHNFFYNEEGKQSSNSKYGYNLPQSFQQYLQQQQTFQQQQQKHGDDDEENWDDDLDRKEYTLPSLGPMPAIYDPKNLLPSSTTNKIDISASVSSMLGKAVTMPNQSSSYVDICGMIQEKVDSETKPSNDSREFRDPRLYKTQTLSSGGSGGDDFDGIKSPPLSNRSFHSPKYDRTSIYDGTPRMLEDDLSMNRKSDKDMRMSTFLDPNKSDIDLRLPFKRVMINYTPATEIDGSISSHPPIPYKVVEIEIPKPDYSEIRRNVPVSEKTLDPRLRRIFCLKESMDGTDTDQSFLANLNRQNEADRNITIATIGGPRIDPRRKNQNQDMFDVSSSNATSSMSTTTASTIGSSQTSTTASSKTLDIRMLLQKSDWYKNLNSKVKIMVNQQLALVSTELKKFHQDPSPNKVFDIQFIVSNQYLQQILTNLGIYIDDYGEVRQLENEGEGDNVSSIGGTGGIGMPGMIGALGGMGMMDPTSGVPGATPSMMPIEFLRGPPPMAMQQRFISGMMPFVPPKPGLLGIAPGVGFNPFDSNCGDNTFPQSGGNSGGQGGGYDDSNLESASIFGNSGNFFRGGSGNRKNDNVPDGRQGNGCGGGGGGRGNRNIRGIIGNHSRNNDRWSGNNGGARNDNGSSGNNRSSSGNRRNYDKKQEIR